jgi:hypothetical protein
MKGPLSRGRERARVRVLPGDSLPALEKRH